MNNPGALFSDEAEKAVLGCMLAQPDQVIEEVEAILCRDDFYVEPHRDLFSVLIGMSHQKEPIDAGTVHQTLQDMGIAIAVGSPGILADLLVGFATHLNVSAYARTVREKSILRQLRHAGLETAKEAEEMPDSVDLALTRAKNRFDKIELSSKSGQILNAAACVARFEAHRAKVQRGDATTRILTGLQGLDEGNGGLPVPSYTVIAGEQGSGKSALLLNLMRFACGAGYSVGGFSMEMTIEQIVQRQVAEMARIDSRRLNGKIHEQEEVDVGYACHRLSELPYHIDPTPGLTPRDLRAGTRRFVKLGCKIIWLDNAQLMQGSFDKDRRVDQLTEVSRTIQQLQREHDLVFILVCQVTREGQKRGGLRAFDLADCAAFERDARVMVMIERKPNSEAAPLSAVPLIVRVAKYSEGQTGEFEATFNMREQRIV